MRRDIDTTVAAYWPLRWNGRTEHSSARIPYQNPDMPIETTARRREGILLSSSRARPAASYRSDDSKRTADCPTGLLIPYPPVTPHNISLSSEPTGLPSDNRIPAVKNGRRYLGTLGRGARWSTRFSPAEVPPEPVATPRRRSFKSIRCSSEKGPSGLPPHLNLIVVGEERRPSESVNVPMIALSTPHSTLGGRS